jgi:hypothetical protein
MSDQQRTIIPIFDEHGQRLYLAPQLAELIGRKPATVLQWHKRGTGGLGKPAGWIDGRTPAWHAPAPDSPVWAPGRLAP